MWAHCNWCTYTVRQQGYTWPAQTQSSVQTHVLWDLFWPFLRQVSVCPHWSPTTDSRGSRRTLPSGPHEVPTTVVSSHQCSWKWPFFFSLYSCRVWSCLPMPYNFPKLRSHLEAPPHSKLKSFSSSRSSRVDLCLGPALSLVFFPGKQRQGATTRQPRLFARMVFGGDTVKGAEWWAACPAQEAVNLKTAHFLLLSDHVTCLFALSYDSFSVNGGLV